MPFALYRGVELFWLFGQTIGYLQNFITPTVLLHFNICGIYRYKPKLLFSFKYTHPWIMSLYYCKCKRNRLAIKSTQMIFSFKYIMQSIQDAFYILMFGKTHTSFDCTVSTVRFFSMQYVHVYNI